MSYLEERRQQKLGIKPTSQQEREEAKKKPIAKKSAKRKELDKQYAKVSKPMWEGKPCGINSPVCSGWSQGWNHAAGKENADKLLDMENGQPSCNACNNYCEDHHAWAVKNGFRNKRNLETKRYKNTVKK